MKISNEIKMIEPLTWHDEVMGYCPCISAPISGNVVARCHVNDTSFMPILLFTLSTKSIKSSQFPLRFYFVLLLQKIHDIAIMGSKGKSQNNLCDLTVSLSICCSDVMLSFSLSNEFFHYLSTL